MFAIFLDHKPRACCRKLHVHVRVRVNVSLVEHSKVILCTGWAWKLARFWSSLTFTGPGKAPLALKAFLFLRRIVLVALTSIEVMDFCFRALIRSP